MKKNVQMVNLLILVLILAAIPWLSVAAEEIDTGLSEVEIDTDDTDDTDDSNETSEKITNIYVSINGDDTNGDGTDSNPYKTITKAVSEAPSSVTVHIGAGTYQENLTIDKSLKLIGEGKENTIIDGNKAGSVITIEQYLFVTIKGVTIQNGKAYSGKSGKNNITGYYGNGEAGTDGEDGKNGGGICNKGNLTISDSNIINNAAGDGGKGGDGGGTNEQKSAGKGGNAGNGGIGGGIYNIGDLIIKNCLIKGNKAGNGGNGGKGGIQCGMTSNWVSGGRGGNGGDAGIGGGIYNEGTLNITSSVIENNTSGNLGNGGAGGHNWSCNEAPNGTRGKSGTGGGIYNRNSATVNYNRIINNSQYAVYSSEGTVNLENNWWGSNEGPVGHVSDNINVDSWLEMKMDMSQENIVVGENAHITVDLTMNNKSEVVMDGYIPDDTPITINTTATDVADITAYTKDGIAQVSLNLGDEIGIYDVEVSLDNQTLSRSISIGSAGGTLSIMTQSVPIGAIDKYYEVNFDAEGGVGIYTWSAAGLPEGLSIDGNSGVLSGTTSTEGIYVLEITVQDSEDNVETISTILHMKKSFLINPEEDDAYRIGKTTEGIVTMTVNDCVSGFKHFSVNITPIKGHTGSEAVVFVHLRNGKQLGINATYGEFENLDGAKAAFNIQPGDVIKVYLVDDLTNDVNTNPIIL